MLGGDVQETVYVLQTESLFEKALPVFVGALAAFIFSVITLIIKKRIDDRASKKRLMKNLSRELKYDLSVIADIKKNIDVVMHKILADEDKPYFQAKYGKFLPVFAQKAYKNGDLFELLNEYELATFDDLLNHYALINDRNTAEDWLRDKINNYKPENKQDVIRSLQFEKEDLDSHSRIIGDVLTKIGLKLT